MKAKWNVFKWPIFLWRSARKLASVVRLNVQKSIRIQLILTFAFCLLASIVSYAVAHALFGEMNKEAYIDYSSGREQIKSAATELGEILGGQVAVDMIDGDIVIESKEDPDNQKLSEQDVHNIIEQYGDYHDEKFFIVDLDGDVLFKTDNVTETKVDLHQLISKAQAAEDGENEDKEFVYFYPVDIQDQKAYLVVSGLPEPEIMYYSVYNPLLLAVPFIVFIMLFYFLTKKKMRYIEELAKGLKEISKGNLGFRVKQKSRDELGTLAVNINHMTEALERTIEEERRAEQTKNELITNVSHDLRTPLTLIMGYLRLLKDKNYKDEQNLQNYVNIAYRKSESLKVLIDDLFEYTKLVNRGIQLEKQNVCLNDLLEQLMEELVSYVNSNELELTSAFPREKLFVHVDVDKMIRVFENLLANAIKYSTKPGEIKVAMKEKDGLAEVCVTNKGEPLSQSELSRLFDRFYRVDESRSSENGGSGLGLAIAKSIVELHNGHVWAESENEEIRFYVQLRLVNKNVNAV